MKHLFLTIACVFLGFLAFSQDEGIYSHYQVAPILVNPAFAGFKEVHQIQFNARTQWSSFPDAPKSVGVQYHGPIGNTFGLGVGVFTESAARLSRVRARLNYAFRFNIQETVKLSLGFSTEFQQFSLGDNVLNQPFYELGDDIIEGVVDGQQLFDASFGVFGTFNDNTYAGISFTNLVRARLDNIVTANESGSFLDYYVMLAGHRFEFQDNGFSLEPSIMLRQVKDAPFQMDLNLKAGFLEDKLIGGLSYRSLKTIGFLLGTEFAESFRLFYTYDFSMQDIQQFSSGAHELTISIGLDSNSQQNRFRRRR